MSVKSFGRALNIVQEAIAERRISRYFDARRSPRKRVLWPGKLVFGTFAKSVDCTICDVSTLGARVRIRPDSVVPNELFLVHLREWTAYQARVVWRRKDGNLGISFKRAFDLEGATKPDLRVMREFCASSEDC